MELGYARVRGEAGVRVVLALLAMEIAAVRISAIPWAKALLRSLRWHSIGMADETLASSAHASINVPSTEKCSSDSSGLTLGWFSNRVMNF